MTEFRTVPPRELRTCRRGVTLLELVVALLLLGLMEAVVVETTRSSRAESSGLAGQIDSLREVAIHTGRPVGRFMRDSNREGNVLALPTGEILADPSLSLATLSLSVDGPGDNSNTGGRAQ